MCNLSKTPQEIITSIIEALNTNPRAFAREMGQPYSKIYDIYRGRTRIFTNPVIESIRNTFHVRRTYLATGEGEMFESEETNIVSGSGDPVTDSLLNVISTMKTEIATYRKRVNELEIMLHRAISKHPDIAELLSECLSEEPKVNDNQ